VLAFTRVPTKNETHGNVNSPLANRACAGSTAMAYGEKPRLTSSPECVPMTGMGLRMAPPEDRTLTDAALRDHAAAADERVVFDDDRCVAAEHTADADAAGEVNVGPDLCAGSDRRPRVDHRAAPTCADTR
jgi:hypothetical protein